MSPIELLSSRDGILVSGQVVNSNVTSIVPDDVGTESNNREEEEAAAPNNIQSKGQKGKEMD